MTGFKEQGAINKIAALEFYRILFNPLIVIFAVILLFIAFINAGGSRYFFPYFQGDHYDIVTRVGLNNIYDITSQICTLVAMFLGITLIVEDRGNSILKIVLTKPIYIRDIIIGKFLGANAFVLLLVVMTVVTFGVLEMFFYGLPGSMSEYAIRISLFIIIIFLECSAMMGLSMLVGSFLKNTLEAVAVTATIFFIDRYGDVLTKHILDIYIISPSHLCFNAFNGNSQFLLTDTTVPIANWFNAALPYIVLMLLEIVVFLAINCYVSIKTEE